MANNPPALAFNSGLCYMIDADTHPTPTNLKVVQSANIDMKATIKELMNQDIFPVAVGLANIKVTGKVKFADYQGRIIRDFMQGAANNTFMVAGQTLIVNNEAHSVPASSAYTITTTNSGTWVTDLGVVYAASGIPLTCGASASGAGIYSVASGIYTFNAADEGVAMLISYTWTTTLGDTITLSNQLAGASAAYQIVMGSQYNGVQTNFQLYSIVPSDLKLYEAKIGDFSMPEMSFSAFVNAAGNLGIVSVPVTS